MISRSEPARITGSLRRRLARFTVVLLVAFTAVGWTLAVPAAQVARAWDAGAFSSADESLLFSLTNQARAAAGLAPVRWDAQLASIAEWRVQDMSTRDYFSHEIPPQGYLVFHYMDQRGVSYVLAGENIGWVSNIADDAATPWIQQQFMNSPEHRGNILGTKWDAAGVGAYKGADGKFMYCVLFKESKPAATPQPTATPTPRSAATRKPKPTTAPTVKPTPKPTAKSTAGPATTLRPAAVPTPTPAATPGPTPTPTLTPEATPTAEPIAIPSTLDGTPVPTAPATSSPASASAPVPSQRIVDAPAPGLLESLIGGLFGLVSGS